MVELGPRPYTPQTLADRWEVDPRTVERLCRSGELRCFKVGRAYRIRPEWVEEYETRRPSKTAAGRAVLDESEFGALGAKE